MNPLLLNTEIQDFINAHLNADITTLILKGPTFPGVETKELIEQIEAKKKSQNKLPTWHQHKDIYYPHKLSIEQTSSELAAAYKASLINGKNLLDLTGGFGVDSIYFAQKFESVTHCEINKELSRIAAHNFLKLNAENIKTAAMDGIEFLRASSETFDWIYVDPSRRTESKGKVFFLSDCLPNIPEELVTLFKHTDHILIKTSPLLDISVGVGELKQVKKVHVVAIHNEVKELLWILEKGYSSDIMIETINIKSKDSQLFEFVSSDESSIEAAYSLPLSYLYEPNAAILKSGGFNAVARKLKIFKLHKHSHLYTSEQHIKFPGRSFKIQKILLYKKKLLKKQGYETANITTRNFPETVDNIRNILKIKDGGTTYLYFTTNCNDEKIALQCSKIS